MLQEGRKYAFTRNYINAEAKRTSHHMVTCQLRSRIPKTFETMIGHLIDTLGNNTAAANHKFVRRSQIEKNTCHRISYSKI